MVSNFETQKPPFQHPITDLQLPFIEYLKQCQQLIEAQRRRFPVIQTNAPRIERGTSIDAIPINHIIHANSPFELHPTPETKTAKRFKCGALLIHGLLDSPFSLRDIGAQLQAHHILVRSVLLPGHGTHPSDLLQVTYHDWIQAVRYGVESLRSEVDQLYLVGYSTGATLSILHAIQDPNIAGIILLAPAIQIRSPLDMAIRGRRLINWLQQFNEWVCRFQEMDYAKYQSVPFNAISQLGQLMTLTRKTHQSQPLTCPVWMAMSREDETISSQAALEFFTSLKHPHNELHLYSSMDRHHLDSRIFIQRVQYPELHIQHFSHTSIMFAPDNIHYGQYGDYPFASHIEATDSLYGAYNVVEAGVYDQLYKLGIMKQKRRELTYNPDFQQMIEKILDFIS